MAEEKIILIAKNNYKVKNKSKTNSSLPSDIKGSEKHLIHDISFKLFGPEAQTHCNQVTLPLETKDDNSSSLSSAKDSDVFYLSQDKYFVNCCKRNQSESSFKKDEPLSQSRGEIVAQRKAKVTARRQFGKLQKGYLIERVCKPLTTGPAEKPDFSLDSNPADFPPLGNQKQTKRLSMNHSEDDIKKTLVGKTSLITTSEKSWKPKVNDPILINIGTALQKSSCEKSTPSSKKSESNTHLKNRVSNILDSSKPVQKKGKVRPDKVKKPSKLKNQILLERSERQNQTTEKMLVLSNNTEICPNNTDQSLQTDIASSNIVMENHSPEMSETELSLSIKCTKNVKDIEDSKRDTGIHSRRFREYCSNCLSQELISGVCSLLEKVAQFQDRTFAQNPIKASAKRRYVAGINQTIKYLLVKKVKLLIIAPDLERNSKEGGLDEKINMFKKEAESQGVPCVFGPNRKQLGKSVFKKALVSSVAVLNYEGAEEQFSNVMEALQDARIKYESLTSAISNLETSTERLEIEEKEVSEGTESNLDDATSSFLAKLKEELTPAETLLKALGHET